MRDEEEDVLVRYEYERGSPATRDGMSEERTPIRGVVSIFSDNKKRGRWELPRHLRVLAIFGSATIDLREADISPGVSVIETLTFFGNIEVVVPPGVNVECDGDAFMGTFAMHRSRKGPASLPAPPGAPVVRVIGDAYVAAVNVNIKAPREPGLGHRVRKFLDG
jgi:hypothetical protein